MHPKANKLARLKKKKYIHVVINQLVFLKSLIENKDVICLGKNKDRYNRLIAVCYSENLNLNSTMVKEGWAIAYRYYSKDYIKEEETAKKLKKGMWQGTFTEPYYWRKKNK